MEWSLDRQMPQKMPQSQKRVDTAQAGTEDFGDLLDLLRAHHEAKLHLCEELEAIADSLPDRASPQACLMAARRVVATVYDAHDFEDSVLWPVLRRNRPEDVRLEASLSRLHHEHLEDESYAEELASVLTDWAMCVGSRAEATGYMLRGFFGAVRRHIAFEREHLVPILEQIKRASDKS